MLAFYCSSRLYTCHGRVIVFVKSYLEQNLSQSLTVLFQQSAVYRKRSKLIIFWLNNVWHNKFDLIESSLTFILIHRPPKFMHDVMSVNIPQNRKASFSDLVPTHLTDFWKTRCGAVASR